ncbi:MAG: nucleotidyl transferase AbiEii/AbiGii toxin family protein [Flavobacteriaceae bacterium]
MGAIDFYKLKPGQKKEVFEALGNQKGIPDFAIEKDWWVVQTLNIIFQMDVKEQLLFKGGTSLSKAWGLIERFSEDIDLALNREYLGFDSGLISKTQVRKLRESSFDFVTGTFYEALQIAFKQNGFEDVTFDFENLGDEDQDPVSILVNYPYVTEYEEYVIPRVKVELGSRSLVDPFTNREIVSFVGELYPDRPFADTPITIPCVNPERTYLEKLFLLHEEFQRPKDKIRVRRLSRHLYDLTKIFESEHKPKALDETLIISIIEHRERFSGMKGVDYNSLYPPSLNPIPPDKLIKDWEEDYKTMQTNMVPGDSLSFEELLNTVKEATEEYNQQKFGK